MLAPRVSLNWRWCAYPAELTIVRATSSLLNFATPDPSEVYATHFPLWKRGTKGDLRTLSKVKRQKIPLDPPFAKGEVGRRNHLPSEHCEFQQTARQLAPPPENDARRCLTCA